MKFGQMLKEIRVGQRITYRTLAQHLGISMGYLCDIERGRKSPPNLDMVSKIEIFFKLKPGSPLTTAAKKEREKSPGNLFEKIKTMPNAATILARLNDDFTDSEMEKITKILGEKNERSPES